MREWELGDTHKIDLCFVAHVPDNLDILVRRIRHIDECGASVNIIPAKPEDHGLDRVQRTLVEN